MKQIINDVERTQRFRLHQQVVHFKRLFAAGLSGVTTPYNCIVFIHGFNRKAMTALDLDSCLVLLSVSIKTR